MGHVLTTMTLLALRCMPTIALIAVIDCAAKRMKISLLSVVARASVKHPHFHIVQIDVCILDLSVAIFTLMRPSWWRVTAIIALYLLLHILLPNQILVPRCVVVVGKELREKKAHVLSRLRPRSIVILPSSIPIELVMLACALEVADVSSPDVTAMLHTATLLIDQVGSWLNACVLLGRFQAVVSVREHLTRKRLSHDRVTTLPSGLC